MSLWELILVLVALCLALVGAKLLIPEAAQPIKRVVMWVLIVMAVYVVAVAVGLIGALQRIIVPHV